MSDDLCECPKCGRTHKSLGFGKPPEAIAGPSLLHTSVKLGPASPHLRLPKRAGFYWAKWRISSEGTAPECDTYLPCDNWEVVQVVENTMDMDDDEYLMVEVGGVEKWQALENFVWGEGPLEIKGYYSPESVTRQLYAIRRELGWNDKTSLDILDGGVRDLRLSRDALLAAFKELIADSDDVDDGKLPKISAATLTRARAVIAKAEGRP